MEDMYYNYPVNLPDVSRTQSVVHIRHPHKIRDEDGRSRREYPRQQKQDMRFAQEQQRSAEQIAHRQNVAPPVPRREMSPFDIYSQMTMRTLQPIQKKTIVDGVEWSDKILATLTGLKYGVKIDTAKTVNWDSTGGEELTPQQIESLREAYDIHKMSPQDRYDLLCDLTHAKAISAMDIHQMHFPAVGNFQYPEGMRETSLQDTSPEDLLEQIRRDLAVLQDRSAFLQSADFWRENPQASKKEYENYLHTLTQRLSSLEHLEHVFSQLERP